MRIYYLFNIREEYVKLYSSSPSSLYCVLSHLYNMRKKDIEYGLNMFRQLTYKIDNSKIDKDIFIKMHDRMTYSKKGNSHIINNL